MFIVNLKKNIMTKYIFYDLITNISNNNICYICNVCIHIISDFPCTCSINKTILLAKHSTRSENNFDSFERVNIF